jgi:hypothetical protein
MYSSNQFEVLFLMILSTIGISVGILALFLLCLYLITWCTKQNNPSVLISFLAQKQAGKDTCSDYLVLKYGFIKDAFAKPVKDICGIAYNLSYTQMYGTDEDKNTIDSRWNQTPRQIMQFVGTDLFRNMVRDDMWTYLFGLRYNKKVNTTNPDTRFQNEVNYIHQLGGYVIKITRPGKINRDMHISEQEIETIKNYDYEIVNDGTLEELYQKLEIIYCDIISKQRNKKLN